MLLEIVTPTHKATPRNYIARVDEDKPRRMDIAERFDEEYWHDRDGLYGYKDYQYIPGRLKPVAEKLIEAYRLDEPGDFFNGRLDRGARILDVGCGMGFLLHEIKLLLPEAEVTGFDISDCGITGARPEVRDRLFHHNARDPYPFDTNYFDLVISLGCLHNLVNYEREDAIKEIQRVGRQKFVMVESYRNNREKCHLEWWAYTCKVVQRPDEWIWEYRKHGYTGDCEFIYFE